MAKRIIISGGGTGGHIYPAIAIANQLKAIDPATEILFVGAAGKMEAEKVPKAGYAIELLPIVGIKRELSLANLAFPFKLVRSLLKARSIIKNFKPDAAVGVGGFASGPLLMVASLMGVPTLIQEQNSYAGITNKLLAKRAKAICVAYPKMEAFFPKSKIKLTGNPVRKDILDVTHKHPQACVHFGLNPNLKTLLIIGGSLGAKTINESIDAGLKTLIDSGYQVIWQTGKPYAEKAKKAVESLQSSQIYTAEFIYEMDLAYAAANVVVSRAGALSVSELCLVAKPCILVPFPFASEDHQTKNAMSLVTQNAALLVKDANAKEELIQTALHLLSNPQKQQELKTNIQQLAKPNAAQEIAEAVLSL
ncbi:MAG: undecaprenyldiphospho-muramoylpentapeptide beta-N-acetylglucosaminyltransferase [Runella slithyformis]|nr:MAG: undecaprenyldiphospho-muramoylpentapeptide beta-N-acetylglucosaminyltransferase [Runella slithyformis]TAF97965.1 MAG: undecaprenyldiphospho-muramoylpentapeptide beta-N-acetylglucosaminyltransferase [Runella sp.]TAG22974.1 MAG: undecaprenyldiphospho-muramoylpentapeptide beta-N-acetylglucosaminyltransferase [Cytophagales bacterium]TAG42029.1 MAG: undecaprenyldiphospho-muramoylpentapeptide beta-N-acetylglucosaminyltransferase [Cytophagia bacterium]TAE99158.1 MAG: undecaprenyldiphospho-mura